MGDGISLFTLCFTAAYAVSYLLAAPFTGRFNRRAPLAVLAGMTDKQLARKKRKAGKEQKHKKG
jgi:hypothetical protein